MTSRKGSSARLSEAEIESLWGEFDRPRMYTRVPGDGTRDVKEYAAANGLSLPYAQEKLNREWDAGRLERLPFVTANHRVAYCYRPVRKRIGKAK